MWKKILMLSLAAAVAVAIGCVRIPNKFEAHITVDIRQHIEEQAAGTLDFIEGKTDALPAAKKPDEPKKQSWLNEMREALSPIRIAYAAALKDVSPEVTRIAGSLRQRNDQVQGLKTKGLVGENNQGYIQAPPSGKSPDRDQQAAVDAENKDRKALYQEIAKLNKDQQVSVSEVERIYAAQRLKRARTGEWVQLPAAGKDFDAFKASDKGQGLGTACAPGAWVQIK